MATKKSGWDAWNEKKKREAEKDVKKAVKNAHSGYIIVAVIFLIIGLAAGCTTAFLLTKNDSFTVNGSKSVTLNIGDTLSYTDEGVKCISFGKDVSKNVEIVTNMQRSEDGTTYTGDTSAAGEYYIKYTVRGGRFDGLSRVRVFTVVDPSADN